MKQKSQKIKNKIYGFHILDDNDDDYFSYLGHEWIGKLSRSKRNQFFGWTEYRVCTSTAHAHIYGIYKKNQNIWNNTITKKNIKKIY